MSQIQGSGVSIGPITGVVVNQVRSELRTLFTSATEIPIDNTIPQVTEGDEILTVTITPQNALNILLIDFSSFCGFPAGSGASAALFQDAGTDALAATSAGSYAPGTPIRLYHYMAAGTTLATTFKIRVGPDLHATAYFNGDILGNQLFGGVAATLLTVTELEV